MKAFFGGTFIAREKLKKEGIGYPIKLEYYKTIHEDEMIKKQKYGIQVVKTEYKKDGVEIEKIEFHHITSDEMEANHLLEILKENEVTPVCTEDAMQEIFRQKIQKSG